MAGLEKDIEGKACQILEDEYGILSLKLVMFADSGWPDRLFVLPQGRVQWAEFKRPNEPRSPRQVYIHKLLRAFGHDVNTYESVEDAVQGATKSLDSR